MLEIEVNVQICTQNYIFVYPSLLIGLGGVILLKYFSLGIT